MANQSKLAQVSLRRTRFKTHLATPNHAADRVDPRNAATVSSTVRCTATALLEVGQLRGKVRGEVSAELAQLGNVHCPTHNVDAFESSLGPSNGALNLRGRTARSWTSEIDSSTVMRDLRGIDVLRRREFVEVTLARYARASDGASLSVKGYVSCCQLRLLRVEPRRQGTSQAVPTAVGSWRKKGSALCGFWRAVATRHGIAARYVSEAESTRRRLTYQA